MVVMMTLIYKKTIDSSKEGFVLAVVTWIQRILTNMD